jgi:hypothetical protein
MRERGHENLLVDANDGDLEGKLLGVLERLAEESEATAEGIGRTVVKNLRMMARMGVLLERSVRERYPVFPVPTKGNGWEEYLPPLSSNLLRLVEKYEVNAEV